MTELRKELRCVLIGGSSSIGKTTLAELLAASLGWDLISTDTLARHPGRPWKVGSQDVPEHVAEHYLSLSVEELLHDVLRHYRGMWRGIETIIDSHTDSATDRLVVEGSALWPEFVASLKTDHVAAIWLTAGNDLFAHRIHNASRFEQAGARDQAMIQKFVERTHLYNEKTLDAVKRLGLAWLDVETASSLDALSELCISLLNTHRSRVHGS